MTGGTDDTYYTRRACRRCDTRILAVPAAPRNRGQRPMPLCTPCERAERAAHIAALAERRRRRIDQHVPPDPERVAAILEAMVI